MKRLGGIAVSLFCAACSTGSPRPVSVEQPKEKDWVRLQNGETVSGKILSSNDNGVVIDTGGATRHIVGKHVVDFGVADRELTAEPLQAPLPPASWYPRTSSRTRVSQVEITFYEPHPLDECIGELAKGVEAFPELWLFAEPGGKLVLHDPRKWGYHGHVDQVLRCPEGQPGLSIELPSDHLPQSIAFVSPAQEMKSEERTSYAIPDVLSARVKEFSSAEAVLAAQSFTGGAARETGAGPLWAFTLPRNDRQFLYYVLDPEEKHSKVLEACFATYGGAILAPDLIVDTVAANGRTIGRVFVLPMPPGLSADGPAPEPVAIRVGRDAGVVITAAVPPRQAVVLPPRPPATIADVHISHYQVSNALRQALVVAYGTGKEATVRSRELVRETAEEHVKIDLSSLEADRFPAVAWFYHRRSFVWVEAVTGKPGAVLPVPHLRLEEKPKQVVSNAGRIPHVVPILFVGPNPTATIAAEESGAVAGGMASGLLAESLRREAGLPDILNTFGGLSSIAQAEGSSGTVPATHSNSSGSVTNIYITIPPHTDMGSLLPGSGGSQIPLAFSDAGRNYPIQWQQFNDPLGRFGGSGKNAAGYYDPQAGTWKQGYSYDPATGSLIGPPQSSTGGATPGEWKNQGIGYDANAGMTTFGPQFIFQSQRKK